MTDIAEYRNLIIEHAELRALNIRLCLTGTPADADAEARATALMAMAMQEAEAASALAPRDIELLARSLRFSIGELTSMPEESYTDQAARYRAAALKLRRMVDEAE